MSDPLLRLWSRRSLLAAFAAFGTLAGLLYFVYVPPRFEAHVTIVPTQHSATPVGAGSDAASRLMELGVLSGGPAVTAARIAAVVQSQSVSDEVIAKLSLMKHFGVAHIEQARIALWSACSATVDRRAELVRVICEDEDSRMARDIAGQLSARGRDAFARISMSHTSEERAFLEKQVAEARKLADDAAQQLGQFQHSHSIVDFPEQAKAVVATIGSLEGQRISKQLQLGYVTAFASAHEANATQLQSEIHSIDHQLQDLLAGAHDGLFPAAVELPTVGYELAQLLREQKLRETVYMALTERLELVRADEIRDAAVFQLLDDAVLPTYRSWPRVEIVPVGGLAGLFLGLLFVLAPAWWRELAERAAREADG
jgi:hypothetical protein